MQTWLGIILGYLFAIIIGNCCITWVVNTLWAPTGWLNNKDIRPFAYTSALVGLVERTLFVGALQFNKPEFIAVWLALKVAVQWKKWEEDAKIKSGIIPGRAFYNIFLIGMGFSIAYAVVGYLIIYYTSCREYIKAIIIPIILMAGTVLFVIQTKHYQRNHHQNTAPSTR